MDESCLLGRSVGPLFVALGLTVCPAYAQTGAASEGSPDGDQAVEMATDEPSEEPALEERAAGDGIQQEDAASARLDGQVKEEEAEPNEAAESEDADDDLAVEEDLKAARPQKGEPALTDTSAEAPLEDQEDWLKWPFAKKNQRYPKQSEPHRWASIGGFVGWVHRSSGSDEIRYQPGIAWGGYLRPELVSWMGLRLFYREERIPAEVEMGAFDYGDDSYEDEFEQQDLEILNLGARLEPTLVLHPRVRLRGIVGWSWLWFRAPYPRSDEFELEHTFRQAVQMDFSFGLGASLDIIENWVDISLDSTYSLPAGRTGSAYEPAQIVRDGRIQHMAPLPELQNSIDVLISLGVIL